MKRRILTTLFAIFITAAFIPAQQAQTEFTLTPVAGQVYMLQGDGGNIGVLADPAGVLLIDSMYQRSADAIRAAIKPLPGGDKIRFLINTHWHSDHTEGNLAFGREATIIAQENIRALLEKPQSIMGQQSKAYPPYALPAVAFSDKITIHMGNETIRLVHYPHAHTNGDTVVFFDNSKVVHTGDMFFNGMFPFLDVANGGDIESWVRQLDSILQTLPAGTKIIPGHGPLTGIDGLKDFRRMLNDSATIVRNQMNEGKTLEQIKAAGLPESFAPWTKGFFTAPQWLELVYQSLDR